MGEPRSLRCDLLFQLKGEFSPLPEVWVFNWHFLKSSSLGLMASLRDEVIGRIEKLELMMTTILELLQGEGSKLLNPKPVPKKESEPPLTKLKQGTKTEAPRADSVPLPPFGWKTVSRKGKKSKPDTKETPKDEEKKVPLRLLQKDWDIQVLSRDDLALASDGVFLTSDEQAVEILQMSGGQNNKLILVTPNKLNSDSTKFECRCLAVNDRLTKVTRWYTNIGKQTTTPLQLSEKSETPKINLTNNTVKIVLQIVKKYSNSNDWAAAIKNPGAALRDWVADAGVSSIIHCTRPIHKDRLQGGAEWIEQVVILKADGAKILMKGSGTKGVFAKRFLGEGEPPDTQEWKIVWVGPDMKLRTVLERSQLLGNCYKGLAHGKGGLGVRVQQESYAVCGEKLLGEGFVPAKDGMRIFEISKVPLWVNVEDMITEMITQMCWVTEFVRINRSFGGYKSFLVRACMDPPKDCVMAGEHMMIIQPAKPLPRGKFSISYFEGKVPNSKERNNKDQNKNSTIPAKKGETSPSLAVQIVDTMKSSFGGPHPKRRKSEP